ncbi:hypothetical protein [Paenibacillus oryzisoli]|nr:hypothetical protein [Paenibacillus oryzisoli]
MEYRNFPTVISGNHYSYFYIDIQIIQKKEIVAVIAPTLMF